MMPYKYRNLMWFYHIFKKFLEKVKNQYSMATILSFIKNFITLYESNFIAVIFKNRKYQLD